MVNSENRNRDELDTSEFVVKYIIGPIIIVLTSYQALLFIELLIKGFPVPHSYNLLVICELVQIFYIIRNVVDSFI